MSCYPTILHQSLDLLSEWQSAELGHREHITGTHRLHPDTQRGKQVNDTIHRLSLSWHADVRARREGHTYTFSSARGGISIARYSLRK